MREFGGTSGRLPGRYTSAEAASLVAVIVFAIVSILAVGGFLAYVARLSLCAFMAKRRGGREQAQETRSFFQTQLGAYTVSLLLSNFLMSIAFIFNAYWVEIGGVRQDALCTAQGFVKQFSITASSYFTSAIAIHAFTTLACRRRLPDWFCGVAVVSGWAAAAVMGIIPAMIDDDNHGSLYGFDGMSCGISLAYPALQLFFQVIPVFLAIATSILFYTLVYLVLRGTISMSNGLRLNFNTEDRKRSLDMDGSDPKYQQFILTVARSLLWYPVAFILLNLADMVIALLEVAGNEDLPFGLHVFGDSTVGTLGLANAVILLNTLRIIAPVIGNHTLGGPQVTGDSESFFAPSTSPIDPPGTLCLSDHKASLSIDSTYKADTTAEAYLTALPIAHVSSRRRAHVDLSDALAALKPPVPPKRNSRPQSPDKSPSRYTFPRSAVTSPKPAHMQNSRPSAHGSPRFHAQRGSPRSFDEVPFAARHKPPPLEEPLRSPLMVPIVSVVSPQGGHSPEARIVHRDAARAVVTSPPHCAALFSVSRPASFIQADARPASAASPAAAGGVAARSARQGATPGATSSLISLLSAPAPGTFDPRKSVATSGSAPSSRAPSVASSTTSFRGLPPHPRALRAAWEEVGAQANGRMPSPLTVNSGIQTGSAPPNVASGGGQSTDGLRANVPAPAPKAAAPPNVRSSTATRRAQSAQSAPPLRGGMPGKPAPTRAIPRSQSSNDIRGPRPTLMRSSSALPAAASASANGVRLSAEALSARMPSVASLKSPSTVSLVGDGSVPLLAGRRMTVVRRSSKMGGVVVSPGGYI